LARFLIAGFVDAKQNDPNKLEQLMHLSFFGGRYANAIGDNRVPKG